jgi:hypothetical protein
MPFSSAGPWATKVRPAPATKSFTVRALGHARGDVDRDAADIVAHHLDLAGVHAGADLEIERPHCPHDLLGTAHGARRAVEQRQEAVAGGLHFAATMALQLGANSHVMRLQRRPPLAVAGRHRLFRRIDDVGEQHGRQHAVDLDGCRRGTHELADLVDDPIHIGRPGSVIIARQLDIAGAGNIFGELAARP